MKIFSPTIVITFTVGFAAGAILVLLMFQAHIRTHATFEDNFRVDAAFVSRYADEVNRTLPLMLDKDTRLDSLVPAFNRLQYISTMVNYTSEEVSEGELVRLVRPGALSAMCGTDVVKSILEQGIAIEYVYRDKNRAPITTIVFENMDCP